MEKTPEQIKIAELLGLRERYTGTLETFFENSLEGCVLLVVVGGYPIKDNLESFYMTTIEEGDEIEVYNLDGSSEWKGRLIEDPDLERKKRFFIPVVPEGVSFDQWHSWVIERRYVTIWKKIEK